MWSVDEVKAFQTVHLKHTRSRINQAFVPNLTHYVIKRNCWNVARCVCSDPAGVEIRTPHTCFQVSLSVSLRSAQLPTVWAEQQRETEHTSFNQECSMETHTFLGATHKNVSAIPLWNLKPPFSLSNTLSIPQRGTTLHHWASHANVFWLSNPVERKDELGCAGRREPVLSLNISNDTIVKNTHRTIYTFSKLVPTLSAS